MTECRLSHTMITRNAQCVGQMHGFVYANWACQYIAPSAFHRTTSLGQRSQIDETDPSLMGSLTWKYLI